MQSGIYYGYLGLIEKIVSLMEEQLGSNVKTVATGGLAPLIAKQTPRIHHTDPDLIMEGLQILFEMNR